MVNQDKKSKQPITLFMEKNMTVKVAKLIDGSEIVFTESDEVVSNDDRNILLSSHITAIKPLCLVVMPTDRGMQAALTPFSFGASEQQVEFELNQNLILSIYNPSPDLENAYRERTSGIVLAKGMPANQSILDIGGK